VKLRQIFVAKLKLAPTRVCATAVVCQSAVSAPKTTHVPVRARRRLLLDARSKYFPSCSVADNPSFLYESILWQRHAVRPLVRDVAPRRTLHRAKPTSNRPLITPSFPSPTPPVA